MAAYTKQIITPIALDVDAISTSQTTAGAGNLTITGVLASGGVATLSNPQHVTITSSGNLSARTFTITGTDRYGRSVSQNVTGPNNTTVASTVNFATVTKIAVDGAVGTAVTAGVDGTFKGAFVPLNRVGSINQGVTPAYQYTVSSGATLTASLQTSLAEVTVSGEHTAVTVTSSNLTANSTGTIPTSAAAVRLNVTAFTSGTITFEVVG